MILLWVKRECFLTPIKNNTFNKRIFEDKFYEIKIKPIREKYAILL